MEIKVDATNTQDIAKFNKLNPRQNGKTFMTLEFTIAFLESERLGKPVFYEVGFCQ